MRMKKFIYALSIVLALSLASCSASVQNAQFVGAKNQSVQVGSQLYRSGCIANMLFIGFGCYSYTVSGN